MLKQTDYEQERRDTFEHRTKVAAKHFRQRQREMQELEVAEMLDEDEATRNQYQGIRIR